MNTQWRTGNTIAWWLHDTVAHPITGTMLAVGKLTRSPRFCALAHHLHNATAPNNDAWADYAEAAHRAGVNEQSWYGGLDDFRGDRAGRYYVTAKGESRQEAESRAEREDEYRFRQRVAAGETPTEQLAAGDIVGRVDEWIEVERIEHTPSAQYPYKVFFTDGTNIGVTNRKTWRKDSAPVPGGPITQEEQAFMDRVIARHTKGGPSHG